VQRGPRYLRIEQLLMQFDPSGLFIEDESSQHSGNRVESHFKIMIVAEHFNGYTRLARQQEVMGLLAGEFQDGLHAVTVRALTASEYEAGQGSGFVSPGCASRVSKLH
jgi:BolA protein